MKSKARIQAPEPERKLVCKLVCPIDVGPLSPNTRVHWAVRHRRAKKVGDTCYAIWHKAGKPHASGPVLVTITLRRSRKMDKDNALACCKSAIDAIFKARVTPDDGPDYVTFNPVVQVIGPQYRERPEVEFLVEDL